MQRKLFCLGVVASAVGLAASGDIRLIDAVRARDEAAVRTLLDQGVDVNEQQGDGSTALHFAANLDHLAIADLLIRAGASRVLALRRALG